MTAHRSHLATLAPAVPEPVTRVLPGGLRVVVQPMPWTRAAAVEVVVPVGSVTDPEDTPGCAALLWEWLDRGAAGLSARERQEAFASLGVRHGGASGRDRSGLSAALLADVLPQALRLIADEVVRPNLGEDELDTARTHALEELAALADRPVDLLGEALNARAFRGPYGRSAFGSEDGLVRIDAARLRRYRSERLLPAGAIVAIAGGVDADRACDAAAAAFEGWAAAPGTEGSPRPSGGAVPAPEPALPDWAPPARHELPLEAQQTQLGWAWPLLPAHDERAPAQALGLSVLAGGMGARLFREVREVRGLAYAVGATVQAVRGAAWGSAYAGTTPERAEETLTVVSHELERLRAGVEDDELARARTGLRTREAARGESSAGRASQLVQDLVLLGRARSAGERAEALARPDRAAVDEALAAAPAVEPTVVLLGPSRGGAAR